MAFHYRELQIEAYQYTTLMQKQLRNIQNESQHERKTVPATHDSQTSSSQ